MGRDKLERVELVGDEKEKKSSSWLGGTSGAENEGRGQAAKEPLLQEPRHFWGAPNVS